MRRVAPLSRQLDGHIDAQALVDTPFTPISDCQDISTVSGPSVGTANAWITVLSLKMKSGQRRWNSHTHVGRGGIVYASESNIYVANSNWDYTGVNEGVVEGLPAGGVWTVITRFSIKGNKARYQNVIEVPGSVLNKHSMDEYKNTFRVATTEGNVWEGINANSLFVFKYKKGTLLGSITDMAVGERIKSVRFREDRAIVVTFRQMDPLIYIDLSRNRRPRILGELTVAGWSDYLHPVGENLLIGLGKVADDQGRVSGVKVSLFDVLDPRNPVERYTLEIGDSGTATQASFDPLAFMFHRPSSCNANSDQDQSLTSQTIPCGILSFPLQLRTEMSTGEFRYVLDGAVVLKLSETAFEELGYVSHLAYPAPVDGWNHQASRILRVQYAADGDSEALVTLSQRKLIAYNLDEPVPLPVISGENSTRTALALLSELQISAPTCQAASAPQDAPPSGAPLMPH